MNAPFAGLPFVMGVTGHRDPPADAEETLRQRFGAVIERVRAQHPTMPLLVLSGLAAGADIWAAEEALQRGVPVLGCLPMPQAEYEKDFNPKELARFRAILPRCWDVIVAGPTSTRNHGYVDVGNFIAYYCHVLVAFWDGLPSRGAGGTADVVELRKGGVPAVTGDILVAYVPDTGPVIQIVTPRMDRPRPADCFAVKETFPQRRGWNARTRQSDDAAGEEAFNRAIARLERFDRDLARVPASQQTDQLTAWRDRTDEAANRLQQQTVRSLQSVYIATAMAGAAQLILPTDGSLGIPSWAGIAAKIAFLAIAFVVLALAKRNDFENRYQDYRAISEALRVQWAWCCAGLRNRVVETSYLEMQQSELEWIRLALRTVYLITRAATPRADDSPRHPQCIRWVEGQLEYYRRSGNREEASLSRAKLAMIALAAGGALISVVCGVAAWLLSHHQHAVAPSNYAATMQALTYGATMPFALGSMLALWIRFYTQQRGLAENARRYHHMFVVFDAARTRLGESGRDPSKVLEQLGHESLSEHAEWLILHRERPLSFVHT